MGRGTKRSGLPQPLDICIHERNLREGLHYQCVFYGGSVHKRLSGSDPETSSDSLRILRVNRNAVFICDSDKGQLDSAVGANKKRISDEVTTMGGVAWITAGREIENYVPVDAISQTTGLPIDSFEQFDDIADILNTARTGSGNRFENGKVSFAEEAVKHITLENQERVLDWRERLTHLCTAIQRWNGL